MTALFQTKRLVVRMDSAGDGRYGAKRGSRAHTGVDYVCTPGEPVLSPVAGTITKRGFAYGDDLKWRIVDIRANDGFLHRLFYVDPLLDVGTQVTMFQAVGVAQDISKRYPNREMLPHVHYEIKNEDGEHVNPETLMGSSSEVN